jgi:hypothetical protein
VLDVDFEADRRMSLWEMGLSGLDSRAGAAPYSRRL